MMKKYTLILFILATVSGCIAKSKIQIRLMNGKQADVINNFSVANVQVINHQIIITGNNLNSVTDFQIKEGANTTVLEIESTSNTSIVANTLANVSFAAGKVFEFVISNANAASTFNVNFSLCDSTLGGKGFNCLMVPNDKDVLSFDSLSNKWIPRNVNGLNYKAAFDASPGVDPGGSPMAGDYYIISVAGTINTVSYDVGDWIVYNADDLEWQKVSNSKDVLSVFGRTGKISAREGDYNLTKMSDVDLTTVAPTLDQILKFNGTNWVPATLAAPAAAAGTAGAPGFSFSGNANTGFFRPAANQIGISNNGVESVRIDDLGRMGIGTSTPQSLLTLNGSSSSARIQARVSATAASSSLLFERSRGTADGPIMLQAGDVIGEMMGAGYDGYLNYNPSAGIKFIAEAGAAPDSLNPTYISFLTANSASLEERMRITSAGDVLLTDSNVAHPMAMIFDGNIRGKFSYVDSLGGGLSISGATDSNVTPISINSYLGVSDPTDSTPAIVLNAVKSNGGVGTTPMGNLETVFQLQNFSTPLVTALGNGNVGIGTPTPGSALDVKGTLRLSGATSGYVGFSPPAVAGTTTYTLPSAPGTNGQVLTTNAANVLSWTSVGGVPAGTSGGIPYYDSATTTASSGVLTLYGLLIGGGTGGAPSSLGVGVAGQFLKSAGVAAPSFANINLADLKSTVSGNLFPGAGCAAGETLVYGTVIDAFSCVTGNVIVGTQTNRTDTSNRGQLAQSSTYTQTINDDTTVNWNNGNLQEINTFVCDGDHTITFTNTKDGAAYSLLLSGAAAHTGVCVFSAGGYNFNTSGGALAPVTGKNVLFTFAVIGGTVVYSMMDDLQ